MGKYVDGAVGIFLPVVDSFKGLFDEPSSKHNYLWWMKFGSRTMAILFTIGLITAMAIPIPGLTFLYTAAAVLTPVGAPLLSR